MLNLRSPDDLFSKVAAVPSLAGAYERVRRNGGCAGTDGQTVWDFAAGLEENLRLLREELLNRAYRPSPLLRVSIEARGGGYRQLSIPAVRDRVAQTAVSMALTPIFEQGFADCSFGYRPGRSVDMAIRRILTHRAQGNCWVVDADIRRFSMKSITAFC